MIKLFLIVTLFGAMAHAGKAKPSKNLVYVDGKAYDTEEEGLDPQREQDDAEINVCKAYNMMDFYYIKGEAFMHRKTALGGELPEFEERANQKNYKQFVDAGDYYKTLLARYKSKYHSTVTVQRCAEIEP